MTSHLEKFVKVHGRLPTEFDPDYLEMLNMGKVNVVTVPHLSPGKCANCGASKEDGRKYVDIGLYIDWYGQVFFCGYCIREITKKIGLFSNLENQVAQLKREIARLEARHDNGDRLYELVDKTAKEIKEHYDGLFPNVPSVSLIVSPGVESDKEEPSKSGAAKSEQGTTKPNTSGGLKNLPKLADLL